MPCPSPVELSALRAGTLDDVTRSSLDAHVRACAHCQGEATLPTAAAGPAEGLKPGQRLGRYVVLWELGRGGMGAVYAAFDPELDRKVALKLLLPGRDDAGGKAETRLLREAQALARVSHPHTITVHDVGAHEGQVFLALEHLTGSSLREWVKARPRGWREVVAVLTQAGEGLAAVHAAGLVHRDFKPSNVMVTASGEVKVLDFGLARLSSEEAVAEVARTQPGRLAEDVTEVGALTGTPGYLAPELLKGQSPTALSDQFAFGVTLYECLFCALPFGNGTSSGDILRIADGVPPAPSRPGGPPPWVQRVVRRCLAADPRARYPDLGAVLAALAADPSRRARKWAFRGGVTAAFALVLWAAVHGPEFPPCPTEAQAVAQVLPRSRHATLAARLQGTSARRLWSGLEEQVTAWARQRVQACEALRVPQPSLEALRRDQCLARREVALGVVLEVFAEADPAVLAREDGLLDVVLGEEGCLHSSSGQVSDDVLPTQRPLALDLRLRLLRARAHGATGKLTEAVDLDRAVAREAADAGLPGFQGEALLQLARHEVFQGHDALAIEHLQLAHARLLAGGIDGQAITTGQLLVGLLVHQRDALPTAHAIARVGDALWERLGRPNALEGPVVTQQLSLAIGEGRVEDELRLAKRRLEVVLREKGPDALDTMYAHGSLAIAYWDHGDLTLSNHHDAEAIAVLERRGSADPMLFTRTVSLATGLQLEGKRDEALALVERARARAASADATNVAATSLDAALARLLVGRDDVRAHALASHVVGLYEARGNPADLVPVLITRARALTGLGQPKEALEDLTRARTVLAPLTDTGKRRLRALLLAEGAALARQGNAAAALARYEESARLPPASTAGDRAEVAFSLARALRAAHRDDARARELARQALAGYSEFPGFLEERRAVEAFLAAPGR